MDAHTFLSAALATEGYIVIARPFPIEGSKFTPYIQRVVDTVETAVAQCADWLWECRDVYFALSTFEKPKVWNPKKIDYKTKKAGAFETRSQANVKLTRSLFIDIDIKNDTNHYQSKEEAIAALRALCYKVGLPKPTIVNSGYGLHVYWLLDVAVPPDTWKPVAEKLKAVVVAEGLLNDTNIIGDTARVLRVPGTINFKRGGAVPVEIICSSPSHSLSHLNDLLSKYILDNNTPVVVPRQRRDLPSAKGAVEGFEGNLGATNDPLNPDLMTFACAAFRKQVVSRGATASEPQWYLALGLARFCEPQREALLAVSDGYPGFDPAQMDAKVASMTEGPPTCVKIHEANKATCGACPLWGKIKSPATTMRLVKEEPPLEVVLSQTPAGPVMLPPLPKQYIRTKDKFGHPTISVMVDRTEGGTEPYLICPYDFYPRRVLRHTGIDDVVEESSVWVVTLPRLGDLEFKMPQGLLSDTRKLHAFLLTRGMHITVNEAKTTQLFMTAYLAQLTRAIDREKVYDRLGWHEKRRCYVLPNMIYFRDGTTVTHQPNNAMKAVTKEAIHPEGTLEQWMDAMTFYCGVGKESYRMFPYASWGAPLFHMTGHKGVLLTASGDTGRGKTTLLEAGASIWGNPDTMLVSGGQDGSTVNAWYSIIGTNHSLPMFWDDTTEREPEEMKKFMLNISQGKGKERMHGNVHDGKVVTWETIVQSSANTDDVNRVMASGKNVDPHLMRLISVEFDHVDRSTEMKLKADLFKRRIRDNFGHSGPIFIRYVVMNYELVKARVLAEMEKLDRAVSMESQERYWSAAIASMMIGAEIAYELGVSPYNPRLDEDFMKNHVRRMRVIHDQSASTAADLFDEFLNARVSHTLTLSPQQASNIDNITNKPYGQLLIRNEIDTGLVYAARQAVNDYCAETKANMRKLESELKQMGILLRPNCHKVLGADTTYATGQTRCWEISMAQLQKNRTGK
jgi:hypothetical protein